MPSIPGIWVKVVSDVMSTKKHFRFEMSTSRDNHCSNLIQVM